MGSEKWFQKRKISATSNHFQTDLNVSLGTHISCKCLSCFLKHKSGFRPCLLYHQIRQQTSHAPLIEGYLDSYWGKISILLGVRSYGVLIIWFAFHGILFKSSFKHQTIHKHEESYVTLRGSKYQVIHAKCWIDFQFQNLMWNKNPVCCSIYLLSALNL